MEILTVVLQEEGSYFVNGNTSVPIAPGNRNYSDVQQWIADGNVPDPYVPPVDPGQQSMTDTQKLEQATGLTLAEIQTLVNV